MSEHKSVVNLVSTVDGGTVCKNRKWARASGGERGPVSSVTPCNSNSQLQSARSQNSPRWELLKERKLGGWLWLNCMAAAPPQTAYSKLNYHTSAPEPPALAIPGNCGMVGQKKKKGALSLAAQVAEHLRLWVCWALGLRLQMRSVTSAFAAFSYLQNVINPVREEKEEGELDLKGRCSFKDGNMKPSRAPLNTDIFLITRDDEWAKWNCFE